MSNYSEYFALEKKLQAVGYEFSREELVSLHTEGKHTGLRSLTNRQYYDLLKMMRNKLLELEDPALGQMRRKIISRMRSMGYEKGEKADMKSIYTWVIKYGMHHKPLNSHSKPELTSLCSQVDSMYQKFLKEVHK